MVKVGRRCCVLFVRVLVILSTNLQKRKREKKGAKKDGISATVLVIANECGGAGRGNKRENGMRAGKRETPERVREGEGKRERKGEGDARRTLCSYGSRYRARSKHCKSISRRLPAL